MNERERANAIYDLQTIARDRARLQQLWDDVVIAVMELEFIQLGGTGSDLPAS